MDYLYQSIGIIGLIIGVISYQFKDIKKVMLIQAIGSLFWATHYILGKAYAGAAMNGLIIIRNIGLMFLVSPKKKTIFTIFISLGFIGLSIMSVMVFNELWFISLAVCIGTLVGNIFFMIGNDLYYRYAQLGIISPCWLFNNCWYLSIGGITSECFNIISVIISIIRFKTKKKKEKID